MSRFRRTVRREVPSLNTASLPDLIFTLLFFFLIVTNMKEENTTLKLRVPSAAEIQKAEETQRTISVYVGKINEEDSESNIQINGRSVRFDELQNVLQQEKQRIPFDGSSEIIVLLKIDKNTRMGLVTDIKQVLRENNLLTVYYITEKMEGKENG